MGIYRVLLFQPIIIVVHAYLTFLKRLSKSVVTTKARLPDIRIRELQLIITKIESAKWGMESGFSLGHAYVVASVAPW